MKKTDIVGNYSFTRKQDITQTGASRQQWLEDGVLYSNTLSDALSVTQNHRANLTLEHTFTPRTSLKWTPSFTYQSSSDSSHTTYNTLNNNQIQINASDATATASGNSLTINSALLLRHSFAKEGRTASLSVSNVVGQQQKTTYNTSLYSTLADTATVTDSLHQRTALNSAQQQHAARFSYTEPLSQHMESRAFRFRRLHREYQRPQNPCV